MPVICTNVNRDVIIWEPFQHCCLLVRRIHRTSVGSKSLVIQPLIFFNLFFFMVTWTSCWTNNWVASVLRHRDVHVTSLLCERQDKSVRYIEIDSSFSAIFIDGMWAVLRCLYNYSMNPATPHNLNSLVPVIDGWGTSCKLSSDECHCSLRMVSQQWFW